MTPSTHIEETRQKVEKLLWRKYKTDAAVNMEELSEEVVSMVVERIVEEVEGMKIDDSKNLLIAEEFGTNRVLDSLLRFLREK